MNEDAEIVKEFLVESYENLDRLDQDLIALEKDPADRERLGSIFRTIHTIKGTSGFLAFNQLEAVTHVGESLLSRLRDGVISLTPEITTAMLAMVDAVRQMLRTIEANGNEGERDDRELIASITNLLAAPENAQLLPLDTVENAKAPDTTQPVPNIGEILIARGATSVVDLNAAAEQQGAGDPRRIGEILVERGAAKPQDIVDALNLQNQARGQSAVDSTIRVDVSLLDQLMNLVGELVLARNQILLASNASEENGLIATSQRLDLITTELQEGVMKTRMQPIGNIWSKFPRTVRDVALSCGKQVQIAMEGKETELDKTIIEAIKDPLTHLVRNAVDHGIETPEQRLAAAKDRVGRLCLRAFHEGGQVNIEITDDGAGLNHERIREKAVQKGLVSADQASRMSEREVNNLIFLPGFSTAVKVTNVSGRGVGMDVVKTNIEKIGGIVDVQSRKGQGTTVRMKIPLTLAIIPALIVTSAGDRYAIPQVSLLELVRLEGAQAQKGIEVVHGAPVHRLRGKLLPLVYLNRELQVQDDTSRSQGGGRVDFAMVREKHQQWVATLEEVLAGKKTMRPEESGSFRDCAMGKWLYETGLREYGALEQMTKLERAHQEFHRRVRNVLEATNGGDSAAVQNDLARVRQLSREIMDLTSAIEAKLKDINIVVLRADDRQFGLVVDEINDTEEIVVKPLNKQLKGINTYAGATIMGDGRVALILDVLGLAQRANVVSEVRDRAVLDKDEKSQGNAEQAGRHKTVLLFQHGENGRVAIDLGLVARLEEFPGNAIEKAGDQEVVQYRGEIMPLLRVSQILGERATPSTGPDQESLHVVVYTSNGRSVGLVVDRILDIVEEGFAMQTQTGRQGVLGSAVIQKRVTDILDVPGLIAAAASNPVPAVLNS